MIGGDDISWQALRQITREWAGDPAELTEVVPLHGGSINTTLLLVTGDYRKAVLKISPHRVNRELYQESKNLEMLQKYDLPVPQVFCKHIADLENPNSYILMEYIDGINLAEAKKKLRPEIYLQLQIQLAEIAASLHSHTHEKYGMINGLDEDLSPSWCNFYKSLHQYSVEQTLQIHDIPLKLRKKIDKLDSHLDQYLSHDGKPRLCHGDFWAANIMCREVDGEWKIVCLIDPHLRYGDIEAELAYMDLFETCSQVFKKTYQQHHRLDDGYHRVRKPIYQLYTMMNSVQLHGNRYLNPLIRIAEQATIYV